MIIDFHAHIYPDKIAAKASSAIGEFYDAPMAWHGTVDELLASGAKIGVDKYVVLSAATKASQVESINNYIIGETSKQPKFIGFGTILPGYDGFENEIKRIRAAGLRGIKIHPDFQKFQTDTPEMDGVYEVLSDLGMPILVHAGDCRFDYSGPKRIAHVLDKHPRLKLVAAHFGGYTEWKDATDYLIGRQVWFDTSSTFWKLPIEDARVMMNKHGIDKLLFGSDFPMWDHAYEWSRFVELGLKGADLEAVLSGNAIELLGL